MVSAGTSNLKDTHIFINGRTISIVQNDNQLLHFALSRGRYSFPDTSVRIQSTDQELKPMLVSMGLETMINWHGTHDLIASDSFL